MMLLPASLWCFLGWFVELFFLWTWCVEWRPKSSADLTTLSHYFTVWSKIFIQQNLNKPKHAFSSAVEGCAVSVHKGFCVFSLPSYVKKLFAYLYMGIFCSKTRVKRKARGPNLVRLTFFSSPQVFHKSAKFTQNQKKKFSEFYCWFFSKLAKNIGFKWHQPYLMWLYCPWLLWRVIKSHN